MFLISFSPVFYPVVHPQGICKRKGFVHQVDEWNRGEKNIQFALCVAYFLTLREKVFLWPPCCLCELLAVKNLWL